MFRKRTGWLWSCNPTGSRSACALYGGRALCAVGPVSSWASCTRMPLWTTVMRAGDTTAPAASKRGARKTMS